MLFGLYKAKETYKDTQAYHKYDILIFKEALKLDELTENLRPELLLKEMNGTIPGKMVSQKWFHLVHSTFYSIMMQAVLCPLPNDEPNP